MDKKEAEKVLDEFVENNANALRIGSGDDGFYTQQIYNYIEQQRSLWIDFIKFIEQRLKPSDNSSSKKDCYHTEIYYKLVMLIRDMRLLYLGTFKPHYLRKMQRIRKGKCPAGCSICCANLQCEHYHNGCMDYVNRPQPCREFPYDMTDQWLYKKAQNKARCNFRWD